MPQASKQSGSSLGPVLGVGGAILAPIIISVVLFFSLSGQANGSTAAEPISPVPGSSQSGALSDLQCDTNPKNCIVQNAQQLNNIQNRLQKLLDSLNDPSSPYSKLTNKDQVTTLLNQAISDTQTLEQHVSDPADYQDKATSLGSEIAKIDQLTASGLYGDTSAALVQWAKQTVDYNQDGLGSIKYQQAANYPLINGYPESIDCSGFVGFVLYKAGILKTFSPRPPNTSGFISMAQNGTLGFSFVTGFSYDPNADYDTQVRNAVTAGTIKPGDLFYSGAPGGSGTNAAHIVMYIGGDPDQDIAESTTEGSKSGPQYDSLTDRTGNGHTIRAVIQPPGV